MPFHKGCDSNLITNPITSSSINRGAFPDPIVDGFQTYLGYFRYLGFGCEIRSIVRILPPTVIFLEIPPEVEIILFVNFACFSHLEAPLLTKQEQHQLILSNKLTSEQLRSAEPSLRTIPERT